MKTLHFKKTGIATFDAPTEKIFRYMSAGGHPHAALKRHRLTGIEGSVVTIDAEFYQPDGSTFQTTITHKLNPPKSIETTMSGGPFDGARFTHSYTPLGSKTVVDLEGEFPALAGLPEAEELRMIDGMFTQIYAEDMVTVPNWTGAAHG